MTERQPDSQLDALASAFHALFPGLERAHGRYLLDLPKPEPGKKFVGRASTRTGPATIELWRQHLAGDVGLGVVPIRLGNVCSWGAIDIDDYTIDPLFLIETITKYRLPLIPARSKSGGAHLLTFVDGSVEAADMRGKLRSWSTYFNLSRPPEIFPKQDSLVDTNANGSWLNMPYLGCYGDDAVTIRYAYTQSGGAMTPDEFLAAAYALRMSADEFVRFEPPLPAPLPRPPERGDPAPTARAEADSAAKPESDPAARSVGEQIAPEGPPCLNRIFAAGPIAEGGRNVTLFNLAVYLHKKGDSPQAVTEYNTTRYFLNPLSKREISLIANSVERRNYNYKCNEYPANAHCDRPLCQLRKYGVAMHRGHLNDGGGLEFGKLTRYETNPVHWEWEINGKIVRLTGAQLRDQRAFLDALLLDASIVGRPINNIEWLRTLQNAIDNMEIVYPPEDSVPLGVLMNYLREFASGRAQARTIDEILLGRAYTENGRVMFLSDSFLDFVRKRRGVKLFDERTLYLMLKDHGIVHHVQMLKGRKVLIWTMPEQMSQTDDFDVPRVDPGSQPI